MRVWTIQGYDLRTFYGRIDLKLGTYSSRCPVISFAQRTLYRRVEENQLVWCQQSKIECRPGKFDRYLHEIEVDCPDDHVIVNGLVWNHIIGDDPRYIPPEDHDELRSQLAMNGDDEITLRKAEDKYLADNLPDDLWLNVTKTEFTSQSDQLLLKFPFGPSTIPILPPTFIPKET